MRCSAELAAAAESMLCRLRTVAAVSGGAVVGALRVLVLHQRGVLGQLFEADGEPAQERARAALGVLADAVEQARVAAPGRSRRSSRGRAGASGVSSSPVSAVRMRGCRPARSIASSSRSVRFCPPVTGGSGRSGEITTAGMGSRKAHMLPTWPRCASSSCASESPRGPLNGSRLVSWELCTRLARSARRDRRRAAPSRPGRRRRPRVSSCTSWRSRRRDAGARGRCGAPRWRCASRSRRGGCRRRFSSFLPRLGAVASTSRT